MQKVDNLVAHHLAKNVPFDVDNQPCINELLFSSGAKKFEDVVHGFFFLVSFEHFISHSSHNSSFQ